MGAEEKGARALMTGELFAIDVDAEIRKLADKRHKSEGESVVELVQFAAGLGPESIRVDLSRKRLTIECVGGLLSGRVGKALTTIMDAAATPPERHQAVVALEKRGGLPLLSCFAVPGYRVSLEWEMDGGPIGLVFEAGRPIQKLRPEGVSGFRLDVRGKRKGVGAESRLLVNRCRFSSRPITLGNKRIDFGLKLHDCLAVVELGGSATGGLVGVPRKGELVNVVTLKNGIVNDQTVLSFQNGMALDVVVEASGLSTSDLTDRLVERGEALYRRIRDTYRDFDFNERRRIRDLLIEYCLQTADVSHIGGMKVFPLGRGEPLTFDEVQALLKAGDLFGIDEEDALDGYAPGERPVLLLDELLRRFFERFFVAPIPTPPMRVQQSGFRIKRGVRLQRFFTNLSRLFSKKGRPVPEEALSEKEQSFIEALGKASGSDYQLTEGQKAMAVEVNAMVYLSRSHPQVKRMVKAYRIEPTYLNPALTLIAEAT